MTTFRIIGPGRAGSAMQTALTQAGWLGRAPVGRGESLTGAAEGVDYLLVTVRDAEIEAVAEAVDPRPDTVVVHLAGSAGPELLATHPRRAAVHPLAALTAERGADQLRSGIWFGVDAAPEALPAAEELVSVLGGHALTVTAAQRGLYHATASVAANHLVALLGQVERLADRLGLPSQAFLALARGNLENVSALGAARALTGPVARGDWATVERHRRSLPPDEKALYESLATEAARLAGRKLPPALP